eukprot:10104272-Prorocentrum_lima.AAC.1
MDKANRPFRALVPSHDWPKVPRAGMDYILGFLTSLTDLRMTRAENTPSSNAAVAGLELRMRNASRLGA